MKIKGVTLLIAVGMLLTCGGSVSAQKRMSDYFYLGGSAGYSRFFGKVAEMEVKGLYDFGVHAGYEFRYDFFLLRVGGNLRYYGSSCESNITVGDVRILDTRYGEATMHYQMLSPLKETQRFFNLGLTLMVGYSQNDYQDRMPNGGVYILAGVKYLTRFCPDILQWNNAELEYATTATYDRYIDDYENMPNHYYKEMQSSAKPVFKTVRGLLGSLEFGWEFNLKYYDKLKLGVFVDCGITNIMAEEKSVVKCEPDAEDALKVNIDTYYRSEAMSGKYVIPFMAGVTFTYSWNFTNMSHCSSIKCKPYRLK